MAVEFLDSLDKLRVTGRSVMADENRQNLTFNRTMIQKSNDYEPMEDGQPDSDPEEVDEDVDVSEEAFETINSQLDALNSALDALENKNDNIRTQLVELLQSNRETRQQIGLGLQENEAPAGSEDKDQDQS